MRPVRAYGVLAAWTALSAGMNAASTTASAFLDAHHHHHHHHHHLHAVHHLHGGGKSGSGSPTQLSVVAVKDRTFDDSFGFDDERDSSSSSSYNDFDNAYDDDSSYEERWKSRRVQDMLEGVARGQELRVNELTDLFAPDNLGRHRDLVDPDQGFGAIFQLDGVVVDMDPLKGALWGAVAAEFGLPFPTAEQVAQSMGQEPPLVVSRCFDWTPSPNSPDADKFSLVHAQVQQRVMSSSEIRSLGSTRAPPSSSSSSSSSSSPSSSSLSDEPISLQRLTFERKREQRAKAKAEAAAAVAAGGAPAPKPKSRWSDTATVDDLAVLQTRRALGKVQSCEGFEQWLSQLRQSKVPVAVVSSYPLATVKASLKAAGLWDTYFVDQSQQAAAATTTATDGDHEGGAAANPSAGGGGAFADPGLAAAAPSSSSSSSVPAAPDGVKPVTLVCSDAGFRRLEQLYLGAALQLERPPQKCAVFDTSPAAMMAAHEADMRAVAVLSAKGPHKPYELGVADLKTDDLRQLSMMNLRGLFADRQYPWDMQPELELQTKPKNGGRGGRGGSRWADPVEY